LGIIVASPSYTAYRFAAFIEAEVCQDVDLMGFYGFHGLAKIVAGKDPDF